MYYSTYHRQIYTAIKVFSLSILLPSPPNTCTPTKLHVNLCVINLTESIEYMVFIWLLGKICVFYERNNFLKVIFLHSWNTQLPTAITTSALWHLLERSLLQSLHIVSMVWSSHNNWTGKILRMPDVTKNWTQQ